VAACFQFDDNDNIALMIPLFEKFGLLPPGIHWVEWDEFASTFGSTPERQMLLVGLKAAIDNLAAAGCQSARSPSWSVTAQRDHRNQA
jgi:hypothetical protein